MDYNLYLKFETSLELNIDDKYPGSLCEHVFADIMYKPDEGADDAENDDGEGTKIGFMSWYNYNQALAMACGVEMTEIPFFTIQYNSKAFMELDHTLISQETIDEVGAVTNPNILVIFHFGIATAWQNKGIGEQVLKGLIKQMKGQCGYIVILNSEPAQCGEYTGPDSLYEKQNVKLAGLEKDPEKAQWKLNAFWQRCGFRQFKNYDNVFVCNVDQVVAERKLVMHPVNRLV